MALRKSIASGLVAAANVVAKDQSKERIQKWIHDSRVKIAKAIEPSTEADTKWIDDYFKSASDSKG